VNELPAGTAALAGSVAGDAVADPVEASFLTSMWSAGRCGALMAANRRGWLGLEPARPQPLQESRLIASSGELRIVR
jgi:hypothetical protein